MGTLANTAPLMFPSQKMSTSGAQAAIHVSPGILLHMSLYFPTIMHLAMGVLALIFI